MPTRYQRQRRKYPKLARRARRQGREATRFDRRAGQRDIRLAERDISRAQRQGASAARSATRTAGAQADYSRNLAANLPSNIAGGGMVRQQLKASAAQTERFGGGLARLAERAAKMDVRDLRQGVRDTRFALRQGEQQAAEAALADLVATRKERRGEDEEMRAEVGEATKVAKRLLRSYPVDSLPGLLNANNRDVFAREVGKAEGVGAVAARKAVRGLYEDIQPYLRRLGHDTPFVSAVGELLTNPPSGTPASLIPPIRPGR